jgi:Ca2+-binding RTX toxin-like protein
MNFSHWLERLKAGIRTGNHRRQICNAYLQPADCAAAGSSAELSWLYTSASARRSLQRHDYLAAAAYTERLEDRTLLTNAAPVFTGLDGTPTFNEGGPAVTLDSDVTVSDVELDALNGASGDYAGASLVIARNGGANADDSFSFDTSAAFFTVSGGNLQTGGMTFATFTNSAGTLTVNFTSSSTSATSALVNDVLQRIQYENTSGSPPAMAQLDWAFSDGISSDTGSTTVAIVPAPDTEITLSSGTLTITDIDGGSSNDQLTISYSGGTYTITDAGGLLIDVSSIAGSTGSGTSTVTVPDTGVTGILFDVLGGDDDVTVTSVQASFSGDFTITGGTGADTATINGSVATTGSGAINVTVGSNIVLGSGSSLTTVDGGITLSANADGGQDADFVGIEANNATIQTNGTGDIHLIGHGAETGGDTSNRHGVYLQSGATVGSTSSGMTAGTITITGTGGDGTSINCGVFLTSSGTAITSVDGAIAIFGNGGNGSSFLNLGIAAIISGAIQSTGDASITITGIGGAGTSNNMGVVLDTTNVTSTSSTISLIGTGGTGAGGNHMGVQLTSLGSVQVTSGDLSVSGTAGEGNSIGVTLDSSGFLRSLGSGGITVTADGNGSAVDFRAQVASVVGGASATGDITINADSIDWSGTVSVETDGALSIQPRTASTTIGLGGGAGTLNLTDAELAFLQDGFSSITIGDATSGDIDVDTAVFNDPVTLITGGEIHDAASGTDINAGTDSVTLDGTIAPGQSPGILTVNGDFAFADDSTFEVEIGGTDGAGVDPGGHDQIAVTGTVTIGSNVTLDLPTFNSFTPLPGDSFTIINNDGADTVVGTFAGLAEGATVSGSDWAGTITYLGGDGNDVVLTAFVDTDITLSGGTLTITDVDGADSNDNLTISYLSGTYTITDNGGLILDARTIAGSTGSGTSTITVPDTGVTGILFDVLGGDDAVAVDSVQASFVGDFAITGGTGNDTATINGAVATTGTGAINVTVSQNITLGSGSSLSTVNGGITLSANAAGTTTGNFKGLVITDATIETTGTGDISLTGHGADNGNVDNSQYGVQIEVGSTVRSTASGMDAGTITINGTGGSGISNNYGVRIANSTTTVTSVDGDIQISAQGGSGSGFLNEGFDFFGSNITSTGTGANAANITINGTGGSGGTGTQYGVHVNGATAQISSVDGDIQLVGQGGSGSDGRHYGVFLEVSSLVASSGDGAVTLNGTGGTGTNTLHGVFLETSAIAQVANGMLTVSGTAGTGTGGDGVRLNGGNILTTGTGAVQITGDSGVTSYGFRMSSGEVGGNSATADITLIVDRVLLAAGEIDSDGALSIQPLTASTTIGLGGGAGTLNLDDTALTTLQDGFSSITIGDAASGTGAVDIDSSIFSDNVTIVGGSIAVTELNAGTNAVTLTARTGSITDGGDAGTDVTGGAVMLNSAGAIGGSGDAVSLAATSLSTDTSTANGDQYLSEADSVPVTSFDAGSGTVTVSGGTFSLGSGTSVNYGTTVDVATGGTLDVNGQTETLTQVTVSGGSLIGTGTLNTPVTVTSGSVAPGNSPGIIATGDLDLGAGSSFDVELNTTYTTAGTDYDQLDVTGTVTLGATLNLSGGAVAPSGGESVIIINNDGSDAVSGTFAGLAEGDPVSVGSFSGTLTYQGGDGNDVALVVTGPYSVDGTSGDDEFEVRRIISGGADLIQTLRGGVVIDSRPADTITMITINGDDGDDTLTVNYFGSGGFFTAPITFNGNGQTSGDDIVILGGSVDTVTHQFDNDNDGNFTVELGGQTQTVTYTGLEPVTDNLNATDRVFTFTGGGEDITLSDDATPGDGVSLIDSTLGKSVAFVNPSGSLTINAGSGADSVFLTGLDSTFDADLSINGDGTGSGGIAPVDVNGDVDAGSGTVTIGGDGNVLSVSFNGGSLTTTGNVSIATTLAITDGDATVDITAAGLLLSAGAAIGSTSVDPLETAVDNLEVVTATSVTITDSDDLIIGGADGGTNGISTTNTISITAGGAITVSEDVTTNAGTNGILTLTGNITVDVGATVSAVDDDITLTANNDGDDDLTINGTVTADDDLNISASRDVLVTGLVQTVGNDDIDITSDDDDDGLGGFQLTAAGQVDSGGLLFVSAASLFAIGGGAGPFVGIDIQDDGANPQLLAARSIIIGTSAADTNNALVQIDGLIQSTTAVGQILVGSNGDINFGPNGDLSIPDGAINVAADDEVDGTGGVTMDDMTTFTAGGDVSIFAGEDIVLGSVQTTDDVEITSRLGSITDGGDSDIDILGNTLIIQAEVAVGSAGDSLDTQVISVAGATDSGGFFLSNNGELTIFTMMDSEGDNVIGVSIEDSVDGDPANDIVITASSPLTLSSDVVNNSGGQITLQASDSAGTGDDLTIGAVTVSAVSGNITLNVGDNLVIDPSASVSTTGDITVNLDFGDADSGTGTTTTFDGTWTGGSLTINGEADADSIGASRISLGATINGGAENDTIAGTTGNDTISGEAGDDDIDGRAGDDLFLWSDGDGSDVIEGGDDSDEIELVAGTATDVDYIFVNNSDGSIDIDGQTITYTGLEPIIDNLDAANRSFSYTGGAETITLSDDATPGDGISMIDSTLGEVVMFVHPTATLTIDAGDGNDTVDLAGLDSTFAGSITVNGGADTDAVTVSGDTDANGGTISVGAAGDVEVISFDGGSLATTGNVVLFSTGAIADNDAGNDVTANTVALGSGTGVGSGANAVDTTVNALEADGGTGGVWISNTGDLDVDDVNATLDGVTATGDIELTTSGRILTFGMLDSNGGNILITAVDDVVILNDVASDGGDITFNSDSDGTGGGGIAVDGVFGSAVVTSSGGNIVLGGGADPTMNPAVATVFVFDQGVAVDDATLDAGTGNILIRGSSDLSDDAVDFSNGAVVTTTSGTITVIGDSTGDDDGVDFDSGAMVSTTSGSITITGTATGTADEGVTISDSGTVVTTDSGQITITGAGANGDGVNVLDGAVVSSTGTSAPGIILDGTAATTFDAGVLIAGTDAAVTAVSGAIQITGNNMIDLGVFIGDDATVSSTGTGATAATVTIEGTGAFGVYALDSAQAVTSIDGDITINGTSTNLEGVLIENAGIEATGTGANAANISISGTSANSDGVAIISSGTVQSADGAVQITGDGNARGIDIEGSVISGLGQITLTVTDTMATGDGIEIGAGGLVQSTGSNVNIQSGDDVLIASGSTVDAADTVTIDGDFADADSGTGASIQILGTLNTGSQGTIRGQGDNDVITLNPDSTTGSLLIDGLGGDDQYNIQVGSLGGQVDIDDQAAAGTDELNVAGTAGDDTVSVDASQIVANTTQIITYTGELETVNVDGGDGADAFDVTPSTTAAIDILGGDPTMSPGDSLTYNAPAGETVTFSPSDSDTGTISATGGFQDVNYDLVEEVTIDGAAGGVTLTVNGSAEDDVFDVTFTGSDSATFDITADADAMPGPSVSASFNFSNIQTVQINGGDGDDLLQVTDPGDGVSGGLTFNGEGGNDAITLVSGTATTLMHNFDNATDGSIDTDGAIINYTGLEPITDNIDANNRVFTFAATDDDITLSDLGGGMSRIESVSSSETVEFTNPTTTLTVNGGDGADTIDASALAFDVTLNGGAGNDSLTGTTGFDQLNGDAGNDTLDGGTSNDTLSGGDDDDLIVWNNGDGSDQVDGDAGTDTLEVNASTSGDDISIDPNGSRFVLTRNNLGLFSLDVGTVETLDLNTLAGADTATVGDLSGVSDLTTLDIDGGDDNDTIDLQGLTGGPVAQLDGGDGDDTVRASTGPEGGDGAADDLNLSINSMSGTLDYTVNAIPVFRATPSGGDDQVIINGSSDDDALTLDFAVDSPVAPGGLFFNGGGQQTGGDNLTLINGTVTTVTHNFTNASDGTIEIEDGGTETITYTGLEPIFDNLSATDRIFNFGATDDDISLSDLGGGLSRIESVSSSETVDFVNPTGTLTVNADDGADTINYDSLATTAAVTLNGGDGTDTVNLLGTTVGSSTTVNGGLASDTVNVGSAGNSLDTILGDVVVNGDDHDAAPTVTLGTNTLEQGDVLNINDQGNATGVSYAIAATSVTRTGAGSLTYGTVESLNLNAGTGDDTVNAATTADSVNTTFNGGDGADSVSLTTTGASSSVSVNGDAGNDTISYAATGAGSATQIDGGADNDTVTGTGSGDNVTILGGTGSDSLTGGSGDDSISGGDDTDVIRGGLGVDTLSGGDGDDVFVWDDGDGNDLVEGDDGTDRQIVNAADNAAEGDSITVSDNGARIDITRAAGTMLATFTLDVGTTEIIEVNSFAGDDTIDASGLTNGRMDVNAGDGVDTVTGGSQNDTLSGNGDGDSIDGGDGDDTIRGGAGADTLNGQAGNDLVEGQGSSGDRLTGETGDDTLDGGMGTDTVVESADQDFDLGDSSLVGMITGNDTLIEIEQALLTGGASANVIDASDFNGSATLVGLAGADTILGGSIVDLIYGGSGDDDISGLGGGDIIHGQGGNDSILGGDGNDTIRGSAGRDTLRGDAGDDLVFGQGSSGDILQGGTGNDTLDGGAGNDRVFEEADTDFVLIDGQLTGGTTGVDSLINIENAQLIGGASGNSIDASGFSGFATLSGAAGDDSIIAAAGGSLVNGNSGADSLFGSQVADTINGGDGDDTINAQDGNDIANGNDGNDLINGSLGADTVDGGAGDDRILGSTNADYLADPIQPLDLATVNNTDNDSLLGGDGNDTIVGALGSDFINGNAGADVIDVTSGGDAFDGIDTVMGDMLDAIFSDPTDLLI